MSTEKVKCLICGAILDAGTKVCPICGVGEEHFVPVAPDPAPAPDERKADERFVIIGSGIAAVSAAQELRRLNPRASVVMVSEETSLPYRRPALSKDPLTVQPGERFALYSPEWYSRRGIFILLGRRAVRLHPTAKQVDLSDGEVLDYDKCILATGAQSVIPPIEGCTLCGVFTLRTLADFEAIAQYTRPDMRAVVIGGGVLGLESAWQLVLSGCHVTVLEAATQLFAGKADMTTSEEYIRLAAEHGVEIRTGAVVSRLEGDTDVHQVILPGEYLNADIVLLCCGARPRVELAEDAGLEVRHGIVVNARMMTDKYGIYACGDCACLTHQPVTSWQVAKSMGICAARNAAGEDAIYQPVSVPTVVNAFGKMLTLESKEAPKKAEV